MLRALQRFLGTGVPVIGVNFGRVGFLRSMPPDELEQGLARVVRRRLPRVELPTLDARDRRRDGHRRQRRRRRRARRSGAWSSSSGRSAARSSGRVPCDGVDLLDAVRLDRLQPLERRPGARLGHRRDGGHVRRAALARTRGRSSSRAAAPVESRTARRTCRSPCSPTAIASATFRPAATSRCARRQAQPARDAPGRDLRHALPQDIRVKGGSMIDHVTANVSDFDSAKGFYAQALAPLGYSVQMEFENAAGFGTGEGSPTSGSARARTAARRTSRSPRPTARPWTRSSRPPCRLEARTTAGRACASTTRRTTRPTSRTPMATTSRRSATGRSDFRVTTRSDLRR